MRPIPDPGFADDAGQTPPDVARALASYAEDPASRHSACLGVLQHARLLVPIVAILGEVEAGEPGLPGDGLPREKSSDMATVLVRGRDGRTAQLAFTGNASMARWDPGARPVPVTMTRAARAARQDGADALVVDLAGPTTFVIEGQDLAALADGQQLARVSGPDGFRFGWVRPAR